DGPMPGGGRGLADRRSRRGDRGGRPGALLRLPGRARAAAGRRRGADAVQQGAGTSVDPIGGGHRKRGAAGGRQESPRDGVAPEESMSDVNMPKLSDTMEEGTVLEWKKRDGDEVHRGEVLAEIESDKAS